MGRILLIDDEDLVVRTLEKLLTKTGHEVMPARNDQEALAHTRNKDFDLIISDIRMPGKNGVEILREIERSLSTRGKQRVPIIFLTGFADNQTEQLAQALNPVAYVFKPFDTAHLLRIIHSALGAGNERK